MRVVSSLVLSSFLYGVSWAYPNGAGSCKAGTDAILTPGLSHATNAQEGGTALADRGLSVSFNGETLTPGETTDIMVGESYNLTITGSEVPFRGFLARIEGSADFLDTTSALEPGDNNDDVQVALLTCVNVERVGGITHTNREEKTSVSGILKMEEPAEGLALDVTVVIRNSDTDDISEWYYSQYLFNAVGPTPAPVSPSPADPPSPMPIALTPTAPVESGSTALSAIVALMVASIAVVISMS